MYVELRKGDFNPVFVERLFHRFGQIIVQVPVIVAFDPRAQYEYQSAFAVRLHPRRRRRVGQCSRVGRRAVQQQRLHLLGVAGIRDRELQIQPPNARLRIIDDRRVGKRAVGDDDFAVIRREQGGVKNRNFVNGTRVGMRVDVIAHLEGLEKQADKVTYHTIGILHKTFITPLDREDIHRLITKMDDILDLMEDAAQTVSLYDIQTITPEAIRLAELCLGCCEKLKDGISLLHNMNHSREILEICEEIDRLESDADHVMHAALSKLFRDEPDVRNLIKLKALYEILENVTDICEDVANIVEGIVVENA